MKKFLLSLSFVLLTAFGYAQSITVTNVSPATVCAGTSVTITFSTTNGNGSPSRYDNLSSFTAYLSSSTGGTPYTVLGTFAPSYTFTGGNNAVNSGITTTVTLPLSTAAGTGYKISVGSTGPTFNASAGAGASTAFTVVAGAAAGSVSANQTICSGSQPSNITIGASTGSIQWQSSTDNVTFNNIAGQTSNTLSGASIGLLSATRYYHAVVTNGSCTATSAAVTITVNPTSAAGAVSANQTICSGSQPSNITIGSSTGTIQWQSSSDNVTFNNIVGQTASTLSGATIGALTATRYYRAVVTSGVCAPVNSGVVTVTVNPTSVAGSVSANQTICSGSQPADITIGAGTGTIQWGSSADNITYFNIAGQTGNTLSGAVIGALTATRYYRAVVTSGVCSSVNSAVVTVTVNPASVAGAVSANQTICSGSQPANITIGSSTGNIQWQSSSDNITFNNMSGQTASTLSGATIGALTANRYYRAVVTSGVCAPVNSAVVTITVNPATVGGTVSGNTTVCANANSGSLSLSGHVGSVTKWQSSDVSDFSVGVLDIPNTTTTLNYLNLSETTYYRAVVKSGVCNPVNSAVATITVDQPASGGTISGGATVCYGNNAGILTLSGYNGTISGWELSLDNFATSGVPIANTLATQSYTNLTNTTYYRAIVGSGTCGTVYSAVGVITVNVNSAWLGTVSSDWNDAGNWSCGIVPTSDVNVSVTTVTNQPVISSDAFARTLTMDAGTTVLVQSGNNLRVTDAITGLGDATITIENNANLIQELDVANAGNAVVKRTSNPLMRLDYTLWSSPVGGSQTLLNFSPATTSNRFYIYNPVTDLYNAVDPSATTFAAGTGYLIRMPNNHPTTPTVWNGNFTGTLNNGDVNVGVTSGTYNAIGNPYPSTLDADAFITENGITEALYFWRKTNNSLTTSYATYTLAGGAGTGSNAGSDPLDLIPNGIIQVGQGFIAKSVSTNFNFNNGMRIGNNDNQFFRNSEIERNRIWLNLTNEAGVFSQTMLAYMTGATYGVDAAIDGPYFNDSQLALTSLIDGNEYAVQGRSLPFDPSDVVPMGFKAINAGTYTIGIDHTDGLFLDANQAIYLRDLTTGVEFDLRSGSYTFASEAGVFNNRFEVVYQTTILGLDQNTFDANQVVVYKQGNDIVINTGKAVMRNVKVYDVRGRLLAEQDKVNASETKVFVGNTKQMLIVKISDDSQKAVTKKIMN